MTFFWSYLKTLHFYSFLMALMLILAVEVRCSYSFSIISSNLFDSIAALDILTFKNSLINYAFSIFLAILATSLSEYIQKKIGLAWKLRSIINVLSAKPAKPFQIEKSSYSQRLTEDLEFLTAKLPHLFYNLLKHLIETIVFVMLIYNQIITHSWGASLFSLIIWSFLYGLVMNFISFIVPKGLFKLQSCIEDSQNNLRENIIKSFGHHTHLKLAMLFARLQNNYQEKYLLLKLLINLLVKTVSYSRYLICPIFLCPALFDGRLTIGTYVLVNSAINNLLGSFMGIGELAPELWVLWAHYRRVSVISLNS